jgi:hypothetical protein
MQAQDSCWLRAWRWVVSWAAAPALGWSRRMTCIWSGGSLKVGERPQDLSFKCEILPEYTEARVVAFAIMGFCPPGTAGSKHAAVMMRWVEDRINEIQPAAVLFDLTDLDYVWGNNMMLITNPLLRGIPTVYLATGRTAKALNSLFEAFCLDWGKNQPKVFQDRGEALEYLETLMRV